MVLMQKSFATSKNVYSREPRIKPSIKSNLTLYIGTVCKLSLKESKMTESPNTKNTGSIVAASLAAIGASVCCIGPLVLLAMGIGGTWISTLTALEPYRPIFIAITLVFLFMAFRKLYIIPRQCTPGDTCALPRTLRNQRIIFWLVSVTLIALLAFPYYGLIFFE